MKDYMKNIIYKYGDRQAQQLKDLIIFSIVTILLFLTSLSLHASVSDGYTRIAADHASQHDLIIDGLESRGDIIEIDRVKTSARNSRAILEQATIETHEGMIYYPEEIDSVLIQESRIPFNDDGGRRF